MGIVIRVRRRCHSLGALFLAGLLGLLAAPSFVRADMLFFKDGFAIEGKVKREMTLEFDKVARDVYHMPKGFFYLDDGARIIFFSPSQLIFVNEKDPPSEERIVCPNPRGLQVNPKKFPELVEVIKAPDWDANWNRRFQFRSALNTIENVPQHIGLLTPYWARADSAGKYFWACAYLTRELGPSTVQSLLATHPDFQDKKDQSSSQRVARRLRKADFYAQAGWLDLADKELKRILEEFPDQKERIDAAQKTLEKFRIRDRLEELKHRHLAGQHQRVRRLLADFPRKSLSEKQLAEMEELQAQYEKIDRLIKETSHYLERVRLDAQSAEGKLLGEAANQILRDLNFENVHRLDAFLGQARQAERLLKKRQKSELSAEQLLSLAISGWLLGSASAETSVETGVRLWRGRDMVLKYLRTDEEDKRRQLLKQHQAGSRTESASLDEVVQIIHTLPPVAAEKELIEGVSRYKTEGANYLVQPPPEYRHSRPVPVLLVLHNAGQTPREMLNLWSDAAAEHGYLLVAPEWNNGMRNQYTYSEAEHAVVLNTLRDLRRRFNVDEDRVFLFGLGEGGAMAFDVGLGHPDLFAGVLPMGAAPQFHAEICWRNGQYLPFYVMHGSKGPNGDHVREQFNNWILRNFPMLWIDYKGRGVEWFGGEIPNMLDWMRGKRRVFPLRQLGTDGGGGMFGNEFCTLRASDNHFYWLSSNDIRNTRTLDNWNRPLRAIQPASLHARIDRDNRTIYVKTSGVGQVTIWLGRNNKGEDMIDFDKEITVRHNLVNLPWVNKKVTPSLEVLLEDLLQRGDRQMSFFAKISLQLARPVAPGRRQALPK